MHYLSDEWLAAADAALRDAAATAPEGPLTIEQRIDGRLRYRVVIARNDARIFRLNSDDPPDSSADAVFSQTESTARSIALHETDAHQAFLLGRIQFEGDIEVLIERQEAFAWLDSALASVMAATTF